MSLVFIVYQKTCYLPFFLVFKTLNIFNSGEYGNFVFESSSNISEKLYLTLSHITIVLVGLGCCHIKI